jgi:hypothetical protein
MDSLEWLARMADHNPDPGKHRTLFCAHYANRARGERATEEAGEGLPAKDEPRKKRRCSASWARLISKIFPLIRSGAANAERNSRSLPTSTTRGRYQAILDYLGLNPPEEPKPPPAVQEPRRHALRLDPAPSGD